MKIIRAGLFAALIVGGASPAWSQATRTWVSGVGDDANPCSRTAPCKTFAGAISKTAAGGEINAIDPGGYGAVTITKSIVIDGQGTFASILAGGATGVIVNGPGIVVTLRNLAINCAGAATGNGIRIVAAAEVNIDNVVIENCAGTGTQGRGVAIETADNVRVTIQNSQIVNMNNQGVHSNPSGGVVFLTVTDSNFVDGGANAIEIRQLTQATVNHVVVTGHNPGAAFSTQLSSNNAYIIDSVFTDNGVGIASGAEGGTPTTRVTDTVITRSAVAAIQLNSGRVLSAGNNQIRANAGNELPTGTDAPR
jgi:hypothetical protein